MAGVSEHTREQWAHFVTIAQKKGRAVAAEKAGVSMGTISDWAKKLGVDLRAKPGKVSPKESAAPTTNGHAEPPPAPPLNLDTIEQDLQKALAGVRAFRASLRQHFGG